MISVAIQKEEMLETIVANVLKEKLYSTHKPFVNKIIQLYKLSQVHHGNLLWSRIYGQVLLIILTSLRYPVKLFI